ncbi:MAG: GtrA family protein [Lachnospiraceae bacterium]|nr:GtrA family protein [Lachnospiraceae bacterium]
MNGAIKRVVQFVQSKEAIRYLIAGIFTTLVNFFVFIVLRYIFGAGLTFSNFVAVVFAIIFAFFANKFYAFRSGSRRPVEMLTEFFKFVGGRLFTMAIEIGGVYVLAVWFDIPDMISKLLTQAVVVVCNYVISKLFVFSEKENRTIVEWAKNNWVYIASFVLPALLFLAVCIHFEITPFGDKTLMIIDSLHQYLPFFSEYYDKLTETGEFLYSWNGAMGYNFLTLWAYYLSSPLNLLILLFPKIHLNMAMTLIIGLKISLSSLTMSYMLTKLYDNKDVKAVLFGMCYAFSNYVIGYYWNIMWLDVLLLTPLVVLGLHYLITRKDSRLYIGTLFLSLFCNFYISFMLCIFLVLWFLLYPHKGVKEFFTSGLRFAISSLVAAGMAAFVLIPTYIGIMLTGPADSEFPQSSWYGNVISILKKFCLYSGSITNQSDDGGVNLYCGILTVFLVVLYFCVREISLGQKVKRLLLLAFFVVSFNNTLLNYVWHGFHDQFGIPNRFSFLMIFVMLIMAYEALQYVEGISFWKFFVPMLVLVALVVYNNEVEALFDEETVIRTTMFAFIMYFLAFMLYIILEWKEKTLLFILTGMVMVEIAVNAMFSFEGNGQITISNYFADSNSVWAAADSVRDGSFYREELSKNNLVDENFWLNLKSVGIFGSTANGDAVTLLGKMGFYTAANEHLYNGATPLTDSLFGVKYLYMRSGDYFDHGFDFVKTLNGVGIYENPYALSLGYMVQDFIEDWDYEQYEPADVLNDYVFCATGIEDSLFVELPDDFSGSGENCEVNSNGTGDGTYAYSRTTDGDLSVTLTLQAKDDKPIYIRATGTNLSGIQISINGVEQCNGRYFFQLVPVGDTSAGDEITVRYTFNGSEADDQTVNLQAYSFQQDVFQEVYDTLSQQQLEIDSYSSSKVHGTIYAEQEGIMMTTVINEPGWHVYVDGEEAEIEEIGDCFIGVYLEPGEHEITLRFVPETLPMAAGISASSIVIFGIYIIYYNKRKRKKEVFA